MTLYSYVRPDLGSTRIWRQAFESACEDAYHLSLRQARPIVVYQCNLRFDSLSVTQALNGRAVHEAICTFTNGIRTENIDSTVTRELLRV